MNFNFGPIARTDAGDKKDTINLASLPLHVILNALVGSTSVEEFIAWLWHDLYKPVFHWELGQDRNGNDKFKNLHTPGLGAFGSADRAFAAQTGIREGLACTHHVRWKGDNGNWLPRLSLLEPNFISDQGDQVNLGATVNYVQLSILSEPAMPTALVRSVIADSFIEVVTKSVAEALSQAFTDDGRIPIEQVKFEFHTLLQHGLSANPDNAEIWNKLGEKFDVQAGKKFLMRHFTPVTNPEHEDVYKTEFTADLTGDPLLPEQMLKNIFSLAELLTLYQDSRTIVIAVPQSQLYTIDIATIEQATVEATRRRLDELNVLTINEGIDYLSAAFESQVEIREVPGRLPKRPKNFSRPLVDVVLHPSQLLSRKRKTPNCKICRITGTPFVSALDPPPARLDKLIAPSFVDTEFVGTGQHIAPLTHLYILNSPNAGGSGQKGVPKRKSMRGAFALFTPATQVAIVDQTSIAVERPPLDIGGRFQNSLNRITVTTQEFTLFQQMSRRIIAELWHKIAPNEPLGLPYLGAVLLTHEDHQQIRRILPHLDLFLSDVLLNAYPFKLAVQPAIEITFESPIKDTTKHFGKHTLLKISPHIISAGSKASIPVLLDDETRINVNIALFEHIATLTEITNNLKLKKRKLNQRDLWLKSISTGTDPVTSVLDSGSATVDSRRLNRDISVDSIAFNEAEKFWDRYIETEDFAKDWEQYEKLKHNTFSAIEEYPILSESMRTFQKQEGEANESTK